MDVDELTYHETIQFLARLAHDLTICARSTYEPATENILEPAVLRAYNELIHRVTGALRDYLSGTEKQKTKGMSVESVLEMLTAFGKQNNRVEEINWVLNFSASRSVSSE